MGPPLSLVTLFKYVDRVIQAADDYCPLVVSNLWKTRRKWARLTRVLIREGVDAWNLGQIYLTVVHLVMLYGSKTSVTTPHIGRVLVRLHHRVACRLTRSQPWVGRDRVWVYPPLEEAMAESGLQGVETYISY